MNHVLSWDYQPTHLTKNSLLFAKRYPLATFIGTLFKARSSPNARLHPQPQNATGGALNENHRHRVPCPTRPRCPHRRHLLRTRRHRRLRSYRRRHHRHRRERRQSLDCPRLHRGPQHPLHGPWPQGNAHRRKPSRHRATLAKNVRRQLHERTTRRRNQRHRRNRHGPVGHPRQGRQQTHLATARRHPARRHPAVRLPPAQRHQSRRISRLPSRMGTARPLHWLPRRQTRDHPLRPL